MAESKRLRLALDLTLALRGWMRPAGVLRNPAPHLPQRDERFHKHEADYSRMHGRTRPPSASAFTLHGQEYMFDQVAPHLTEEMELDRPYKDRSDAAKALAAALHYHEMHTHHVQAAETKLLRIYERMRPIGPARPPRRESEGQ